MFMHALNKKDTIVLNKNLVLPPKGIICAHPGRVKRIAQEFLTDPYVHTDYRGYQVYVGLYLQQPVFVANTGIGAPAAAFLLEELVTFGVSSIIRLGSNDSSFARYDLKLVERTTLPLGLCFEYGIRPGSSVRFHPDLAVKIINEARRSKLSVTSTYNRHIDSYYAINFLAEENDVSEFTSADMESGALYLLGQRYGLEYATLLLSYPKHGIESEYGDEGRSADLEAKGIRVVLNALINL
jgi:5'-methylthioadenosine phosphorylase